MTLPKRIIDPDWSDLSNEREQTCLGERNDLLAIGSINLANSERMALDVMRHVCASFQSGEVRRWQMAHDLAEFRAGLVDGPILVARAVALLRAVETSRQTPFNYLSAECPDCRERITRCETELLLLVKLARRGPSEMLTARAAAFAQRDSAPKIDLAVRALGAFLVRFECLSREDLATTAVSSKHIH
jgi:hypothetical protein